ncbi:kinase-like domain-containing protein, partial [Mycena floridula]
LPDLTGRLLADGRYKLDKVIRGHNFPGIIYKAVDMSSTDHSPNFVTIKCMWKPKPGSPEEISMNHQFSLHQRVSSHPNILPFIHHFTSRNFVFVVLPFHEGESLIKSVPLTDNDQVKKIMAQLIDAVEYCHQHNVYHGDLRPENIWLATDGQLYIADFGSCTDQPVCTPRNFDPKSAFYLSPEAMGTDTDNRPFSSVHADIWALGIILSGLITFRYPWIIATRRNSEFAMFLTDPKIFGRSYRISQSTTDILEGVLAFEGEERTSLPDLREQIFAISTFFRSD